MTVATHRLAVSVAFVQHYRSAYAGAGILLSVATVIATAELVLYAGLASGQAVEWESLSVFDERVLRAGIRASQGILQIMCFTTVAVAVVLVFLGLRNMLALRHREFGQMRLAGASVLRIRAMLVLEAVVFAAIVVIPSVIVGHVLAHPLYLLMQSVGVFEQSLRTSFEFPPLTLLGIAGGMILCAALAAWFGFQPRRTANIVEALEAAPRGKAAARMGVLRIVVAVLSVLGLAAFLIFMPDTGGENPFGSIIVPLLIVFPLGLLAPLLVPAVASALAWILRPILRGPGVLVAQRANRDSRRFASNVLPLLIVVGVMGGFAIGAGADQASLRADYGAQVTADLVAETDTAEQADVVVARAANDPRISSVMRSGSTNRLIEVGQPDGNFLTVFNFIDIAAYKDMFATHLMSGTLDRVGSTQIVSTRKTDHVGDVITIDAPNGSTVQYEVGAVITSRIYTGLLLDWASMSLLDPQIRDVRVFLTTAPGQTEAIASELSAVAPVLTKDQFIRARIELRGSNASTGNIALFGTVYFLAVVAMIQGVAASVLSRRPEYRLLSMLGISRPRIVLILLSEVLVLVVTSAVLLAVAFVFIAWRYLSDMAETLSAAIGAISWGSITLTFGGMSALFAATVLIASLPATRRRES